MNMPEEVNRILTGRISSILFCPTDAAIENLNKEGYNNFDIKVIKNGDVMKDAAMFYSEKSAQYSSIINDLKLETDNFILTACHRAENTDDIERLSNIFSALDTINETTKIVLPLHPRTKSYLAKFGIKTDITLIDPIESL